MRVTHQAWWCPCGDRNSPNSLTCASGIHPRFERHARVHASERSVVYYNPSTGEHRTPGRADLPVPEVYAKQGFERREIMNMGAWEKEAGVIHEASNYNPGNEDISFDPRETQTCPPELKQQLVDDIRAAAASGPWTGAEKFD